MQSAPALLLIYNELHDSIQTSILTLAEIMHPQDPQFYESDTLKCKREHTKVNCMHKLGFCDHDWVFLGHVLWFPAHNIKNKTKKVSVASLWLRTPYVGKCEERYGTNSQNHIHRERNFSCCCWPINSTFTQGRPFCAPGHMGLHDTCWANAK